MATGVGSVLLANTWLMHQQSHQAQAGGVTCSGTACNWHQVTLRFGYHSSMGMGRPDAQVQAYLEAFADEFCLRRHVRLLTRVLRVDPLGPPGAWGAGPWAVSVAPVRGECLVRARTKVPATLAESGVV